jgi:anti-sigma regulatory factor (Ser/Thr protein kinase)
LSYRDVATRVVSSACKLVGQRAQVDERRRAVFHDEVLSAFGEAFNNVVLHAFEGRSDGEIVLEIDGDAAGIVLRLMDRGSTFAPELVPAPDLSSLPEGGLGLFIMRSFMDEVRYAPGSPNVLSLSKRL